jgi:hypothetical protein
LLRRFDLNTTTIHSANSFLGKYVTVPGKLDLDCNA